MPRLLLVDDNQSIHRIVTSLLDSTGIEIVHAVDPTEALGLIVKEAPFDVALIDTSLPEMDGWELLRRIRISPKAASIPIAVMAGVLEDVDTNHVENATMQAFLRKPVDLRDLPERVGMLLNTVVEAATPTPKCPEPAQVQPHQDDLLILGKEDLADDEIETPDTAPLASVSEPEYSDNLVDELAEGPVTQEPSVEPELSVGDAEMGVEETISLELEDLDFRDLGYLQADSAGPTNAPPKVEGLVTDVLLDTIHRELNPEPLILPDRTVLPPAFETKGVASPLASHIGLLNFGDPSGTDGDFTESCITEEDIVGIEDPASLALPSIMSELLSNEKFIDDLAKAVEVRMRCMEL